MSRTWPVADRVSSAAVLIVLALLVVNLSRWGGGIERLPTRWAGVASVPAVVAAGGGALPVTTLPAAGVAWGVYDPGGQFIGASDLTIEQVYQPWSWAADRGRAATEAVGGARARGRVPLVGVEPWPFVWAGMAEATLLADIVAGAYDVPIRETCVALGRQAPQTVLVRWGHEMDMFGRFPWSTGDPAQFVGAYRQFVDTCRATGATNLRFVWSPGGAPDLREYWPGAEYVDYVGLTVLGFGARDVAHGAARPHTFRELFDTNYALVQDYGKPVLVCEFASTGPAAHQERWVAEAAEGLAAYPLLRGVVYFNAVDPVAWGDSGVPDWRIAPAAFPPPRPVNAPPSVRPAP